MLNRKNTFSHQLGIKIKLQGKKGEKNSKLYSDIIGT